jgi:hypothetical protein
MSYRPNNELVGVAWLKAAVPSLGDAVATSLPTDSAGWPDGFTTVATVGGTPDNYVGWRKPVLSVDVWAAAASSGRPPWNLASQAAEAIRAAVLDHQSVGRAVAMPSGYLGATVGTVIMRSEPARRPGDVASYAHYQMDLELWWKELAV